MKRQFVKPVVVTCPVCGWDKWDGQHGHPFGGRRTRNKTRWCVGFETPELDAKITQAMRLGVQYTLHLLGIDRDGLAARFVEQEFQAWVGRYRVKTERQAAAIMAAEEKRASHRRRKPLDGRHG